MRGPFTVAEARNAGLNRWHLEGASWKRLARGTYVWSGVHVTPMAMLAAVLDRLPATAAFSGLTAAWLHGMDFEPCSPIEVTVPHHAGVSKRSGVRIRRAVLFGPDVVRVRGMPAIAIARTVAEICMRSSLMEAVVVADAALHSRRVTRDQLTSWADAHRRHPGIRRLRRVMDLAEAASESPMESRLRMLLVLGGLPQPRAQVVIRDDDGRFIGRPELYYEGARLGIEYDGGTHRSSLAEDNHRQNNLLGAGVRLLRFTYADVMQDPASVVMHVKAMLRGA